MLLDGHAQESTCCDRIVDDLNAKDVILGDRHYRIVALLEKIAAASGFFVIRQHGRLKGILLEKRQRIGRIDMGTVYEQEMNFPLRKLP